MIHGWEQWSGMGSNVFVLQAYVSYAEFDLCWCDWKILIKNKMSSVVDVLCVFDELVLCVDVCRFRFRELFAWF